MYLVSHEKHVGTENAPNRSIFIRFELSFFLNWSEFNQRSIGTSAMLPACLVSKLRTNLCMGPICEICYIVWVQARLSQFIEEKSPKNYKLSEWVTDTRYRYRYRYWYGSIGIGIGLNLSLVSVWYRYWYDEVHF